MENTYVKWTIIDHQPIKVKGKLHYKCRCVCGVEKTVYKGHLVTGASTACRVCSNIKHGCAKRPRHTLERSTYSSYVNMCSRCNNVSTHKAAKCYQENPVKLCKRWVDGGFEVFLQDMGIKPSLSHSIDRIDNDNREYSPDNCRWATKKEQMVNTKSCRKLTYNGVTQTIKEWAEELNIPWATISNRVYRGCTVEDALFRIKGKHARV